MNTTKKHEDRSHAFASPSDSKRWMTCHGSLNLEKKLKDKNLIPAYDEGSPAAAEGTRLHEVAEKVLSGEILICPTEVKPYSIVREILEALTMLLLMARSCTLLTLRAAESKLTQSLITRC